MSLHKENVRFELIIPFDVQIISIRIILSISERGSIEKISGFGVNCAATSPRKEERGKTGKSNRERRRTEEREEENRKRFEANYKEDRWSKQ